MAVTESISLSTKGRRDVLDITPELSDLVRKHGIESGAVVVFVPGSTAALTTIEYEPGLKKDVEEFLDRIIPYGERYHHHDTWHDDNGSSHLQAAMLGPSITIPVVDGKLTLGTWQQVVLVDCDTRPRNRQLVVQMLT